MKFTLHFSTKAKQQLQALKDNSALVKRYKAVGKTLALLSMNPRHSGLNTHKYHNFPGYAHIEVFEVYAENKTPQAYRIFWHYGHGKGIITMISITPHP